MINIYRVRYHRFFLFYTSIYPPPIFFFGGVLRLYKVFIAHMYNIEPPKSISFYPLFHFKIFIFTKIEPSSSSGQPNQFLKDNDYKLYVVHMSLEYVYTVYCGSLSFMCIKFFLSKIYLNLTTIESLLFLMDIYFHALPKQWFVFNQYGRCQCCISFHWNMTLLKFTGIC